MFDFDVRKFGMLSGINHGKFLERGDGKGIANSTSQLLSSLHVLLLPECSCAFKECGYNLTR